MRQYRLFVIIRSSLKEADRKKLFDSIKDLLGKVKVGKVEEWGQKPLAYPIKREVSGVFAKIEFEGENIALDLEKKLLANDNVLRHLLLKI
jgi:small subunit ribosomal protein S6